MRVAFDQLNAAQSDSDLVEVADYLWQMALRIENGDLSEAERDLRAAEQQLRDALQRNAPEDEIRKLGENLRAAMDKFLQELAAQQNDEDRRKIIPQRLKARAARSAPRSFKHMLDKMQDMLRSGDSASARRKCWSNCKTSLKICASRGRARPIREPKQMSRALDELGRMSQDQQDLRDETYQNGQAEQAPAT